MARGLRGFERPPRWGVALLIISSAVFAVALVATAVRSHGEQMSAGQVQSLNALASRAAADTAEKPTIMFAIGDSYTAGTGDSTKQGFACRTAKILNWTCVRDGEGGTGYINDGHSNSDTYGSFASRLAKDRQYKPDIITVAGGLNDGAEPTAQFTAAATSYLRDLHAAFPQVPTVIIGPYWPGDEAMPKELAAERDALRSIAQGTSGFAFLDPQAEGWFTASQLRSDNKHPDDDGHQSIATHLAGDLQRLNLIPAGASTAAPRP